MNQVDEKWQQYWQKLLHEYQEELIKGKHPEAAQRCVLRARSGLALSQKRYEAKKEIDDQLSWREENLK